MLLEQAAMQRATLATLSAQFDRSLNKTETAFSYVRLLKSPWVLAGLGAVLFKMRAFKLVKLPKLLWKAWTIVRFFRRFRF